METLEELKAIIANAPFENIGEDIFINALGNYVLFYEDDYFVRDGDKWVKCCGYLPCYGLRSLSDIERIIELMEQLNKIEPAKEECKHPSSTASYTHVTCDSCHMIRTDGGWGCASRKWFDNIESAKFYEKNGFLPK